MSRLLYSLGRACFRLGWKVLAGWLAVLATVAALGFSLGQGTDDSLEIPGIESADALVSLAQVLPAAAGASALTVVILPEGLTIDDPDVSSAINAAVEQQSRADQVGDVMSPLDELGAGAVNEGRTAAIIEAQYEVEETLVSDTSRDMLNEAGDQLRAALPAGSEVHVGGEAFMDSVPTFGAEEGVGVVVAFLVLMVLFRSVRTSIIPVVTALGGVAIVEMTIQAGTAAVSIMSTAPLLAVMIGLAVGIDYALFIVSRYRDELLGGAGPEEAAALANATAGSAVLFSGATTLIALLGLFVVGIPFLTIMGICSAIAVGVAVCVSTTAIPACLRYLGDRPAVRARSGIAAGLRARVSAVFGRRGTAPRAAVSGDATPTDAQPKKATPGAAERWVRLVTARPVTTLVAGLGIVIALALPVTSLQLALPSNGFQPVGTQARDTYDIVAEEFGEGYNGPLVVTVNLLDSLDPVADMERLGDELSEIEGVRSMTAATPEPSGTLGIVHLQPEWGPDHPETAALVERLRDESDRVSAEYPFRDYSVTGVTATQLDVSDRLGSTILPFGLFVVGLTLVLLVMVFRSIVVPIKAAVGYLLSLGASLGVVSLVFVLGVGADALDVSRTGSVVSFLPIIVMAVLFGLAMDYQVFIVSRMAEARVKGRDPLTAVREGFTQSAPVVTAAALIMVAVFVAFVPQDDPIIKPMALALAVGVLVDAFLVRMTLVPAVLALIGRPAWELPRWLAYRIPEFDPEGETIAHQLRLADWRPDELVSVEGLDIRSGSGETVARVEEMAVRPGEIALLRHDDPRRARAVLDALSGRLTRFAGNVKVAGHVLPNESRVLRRVASVHTGSVPRTAGECRVEFVVGLDDVAAGPAEHTEEQREVLREFLAGGGCVVATARRVAEVRGLLPDATVRVIDVDSGPVADDVPAQPDRTVAGGVA